MEPTLASCFERYCEMRGIKPTKEFFETFMAGAHTFFLLTAGNEDLLPSLVQELEDFKTMMASSTH